MTAIQLIIAILIGGVLLAVMQGVANFFKMSAKAGANLPGGIIKRTIGGFKLRRANKENRTEDKLILEGLKADAIAKAKTENYQGTAALVYFYNKKNTRISKKAAKAEKK